MPPAKPPQVRGAAAENALAGTVCCYLTSLIVMAGVWFSLAFVHSRHPDRTFLGALGNWDGNAYAQISSTGYTHDPQRKSNTAFFPAYPLLGRAVMRITGLEAKPALLIVAHLCLLAAFVLLAAYVKERYAGRRPELTAFALVAMGLWPTTFFFRMAYTESLFLLLTLLAMYGMLRGWRPLWIALVIGAATATRAPGIALLAVFAWHLWRESRVECQKSRAEKFQPSTFNLQLLCTFSLRAVWLLPLACWGLIAFLVYLHLEFGNALAFAEAQEPRYLRVPETRIEHVAALATLEPIWSVYDPSSVAYWARGDHIQNPLFNLQFANPIYFLLTAGLIVLGAWKRWLNAREWILAALLLLIPYVSLGYQNLMLSQGRFAAVVFPVYLVLGQLARAAPYAVVLCLFGLSGFLLGAYAALFAAYYRFF